jgi:hypothetical protein
MRSLGPMYMYAVDITLIAACRTACKIQISTSIFYFKYNQPPVSWKPTLHVHVGGRHHVDSRLSHSLQNTNLNVNFLFQISSTTRDMETNTCPDNVEMRLQCWNKLTKKG